MADRGEKFADAAEEIALLEAFVGRKGQFAGERPAPKPAAASTEGDDSAVFLTAAAGLVEPTTAMAATNGAGLFRPLNARGASLAISRAKVNTRFRSSSSGWTNGVRAE